MFKTIGILAHVDAGKTTFSEQLLYHMESIKEKGRVDNQDAHLDFHSLERARGITIFAEQGRFHYGDDTYTLIDTPGHIDFSPEMERAIRVMDYAIVIVSAVEGIQGHTATVWQLLKKYNVPTFLFINKIDREGANPQQVLAAMRQELSEEVLFIEKDCCEEAAKEWLAERDEQLLELFLEGKLANEMVIEQLQQQIAQRKLFVCMKGAALKDEGVLPFFQQVAKLTITNFDQTAPFQAEVFKIRHDASGQRLTFMKALQGSLQVRDAFTFGGTTEKITEIRQYNGAKFETTAMIEAGEIFAVKGISQAAIGHVIGRTENASTFELVPTLQAKVVYDGSLHMKEVWQQFRLLNEEEPSLRAIWQEELQEIQVHVMGVIQLEVLVEIAKERFNLPITFANPQIIYKETIATTVTGYGHFEPLKHYAEVHLLMEPTARGTGIEFQSVCHADDLSVGHIRLVEQHLFERAHHGLLTGAALTDVKFTLLTGRAHVEYTSGGDFREATFRALRQGLEQAENILLEPYYYFKMKAASDFVGRMMFDVQQAQGMFEPPVMTETTVLLVGKVPVATFMNYSTTFAAYTNGKGVLSLQFAGYDVCHNAEEIIAQKNYDKNADPLYTSASIFCKKGKGEVISWDEAKNVMHCLK
ncbi:TetM/TetW/TetO/TetS family tetracycline resistance ribosomal protection protein [Metasolibacillus meyeri]|uniref:TetM/TetW/TetO/TetS family tetracycline resistance ribosomal protection protein n=1 Tax=Metasolibacillus meyeri TaxID=1071052 RepID=A0AAW9NLR4_9BACL|nr:translation factor GTPase family protein [Metasolibacillus meyeri]MEC1178327.1 TetM/TetW/TetO/TetS family tetracycline resistance ribosomal protection protein [Metasolibacillus meyeri]